MRAQANILFPNYDFMRTDMRKTILFQPTFFSLKIPEGVLYMRVETR